MQKALIGYGKLLMARRTKPFFLGEVGTRTVHLENAGWQADKAKVKRKRPECLSIYSLNI